MPDPDHQPDPDPAAAAAAQLVEVVDDDGRVLEVVTRAALRATRMARHRCTYVVVLRPDGRVVVHRRAGWKDVSPGCWDLAFGGLCDVGEGWAEAAARELAEEAGLADVPLVDLGEVRWDDGWSALLGRVFVALTDAALQPADGEVVALDEVPIDRLDAWLADRPLVDDTPAVVPPLLRSWWAARPPRGDTSSR